METKFKETEIGLIPNDWNFDYLSNHLIIKGRIGWKGLKKSEYLKDGTGIAIINGLQIQGNKINWDNCGRVQEWRYDESPEIQLQLNDIVMTKDGTIGKVAYIDKINEKTSVASGIFVIRELSKKINQKFLFYYFKSPIFKWLISSRKEGSVIPHLYQRDFEQFPIATPQSLEEQKLIAKILSDLDEKIEINRKINENLGELGQTLFKRWFVDLEFPNERGEPYKSSGGDMIESESGEIPKCWENKELKKVTNIINGFAFKSQDYETLGYKVIRSKNFNSNKSINLKDLVYISKINAKKYSKFNLQQFDFLLVMVGASIGKNVIVNSNILPALQNQNMWNFRAKENYMQHYLNFNFEKVILNNIGCTNGSARDFFRKDFFYKIKILIPEKDLIERFNIIYDSIAKIKDLNLAEIHSLQQIRDSLLPKLISGQIRVKYLNK